MKNAAENGGRYIIYIMLLHIYQLRSLCLYFSTYGKTLQHFLAKNLHQCGIFPKFRQHNKAFSTQKFEKACFFAPLPQNRTQPMLVSRFSFPQNAT
jgi:hypothetical protein